MGELADFTEEQKQYLQGYASGLIARRGSAGLAPLPGKPAAPQTLAGPESIHRAAQDRVVAEGKKLAAEEEAKRAKNPLDSWGELVARAERGEFPKGTDVFLTKYHGLFYVAPAQNAYMCRLRIPNGILDSRQLAGIAALADAFGGGYADVTTRANLQVREIKAENAPKVLTGLWDLGLTSRGSGADNIRNITGSPTAGIDKQELIDTRAYARDLHYHILNHREMYGLPRKFNIAFDGGGSVAVLEDTNDIAFTAVTAAFDGATGDGASGVWFRLGLGGITGHGDFARPTNVLVPPDQCTRVAAAVVRAFIEHGDRTDRRKARLKYVLDRLGLEAFLAETEKHLGGTLLRVPENAITARVQPLKHGHVGVHAQKQDGLFYVGLAIPVGRMSSDLMRGIADVAARFGSGTIRLTVWQNLLLSDIPKDRLDQALAAIAALGIGWSASSIRGGLIACTGNTGCKFSASNTKAHALAIAEHLEAKGVALDQPINIHLTGCHHSCAQHYVGDIGLLATKVEQGEEQVEGYSLFVGGGAGTEARLAREIWSSVPFAAVPPKIEAMLRAYLSGRAGPEQSFYAFCNAREADELKRLFAAAEA